MIDIENFKNVNDEYGHVFGDQLLRTIAQTIRESLRETDLIGRWGGDEFVALLINTGLEEAHKTAERIKKAVSDVGSLTDQPSKNSISISASPPTACLMPLFQI